MKNERKACYENRIDELRKELHTLIEHEKLDSASVQKMSRELDSVIMQYYRRKKLTGS